ncbi:MAG: hypothetical protein PHO44_03490 [Sphaerochaetaceae bacterium]|nr:hypothetical protein [Sphaerochaetaceae bacterium]MDD3162703.1 hypothetical protein [Sphaerochaetaceae bacterium]MDD4007023.1 hypothetical protein [Sphaerochaetaceae bacterium]MDD4396148.1 hypothetical protein [Sphaerochaetaceae bacterium]
MLTVIKALLLASVLLIIFIPNSAVGQYIYFGMFLVAMILVYFYWRLSYWVSDEDVKSVNGKEYKPLLSVFVGKVPASTSDDLARGRLVITASDFELYQLPKRKAKDSPKCTKVWSLPREKVQSFGFGKVIGARKGFIIYTSDDQVSFTSLRIFKHREQLFDAMGWPYTPPVKKSKDSKKK